MWFIRELRAKFCFCFSRMSNVFKDVFWIVNSTEKFHLRVLFYSLLTLGELLQTNNFEWATLYHIHILIYLSDSINFTIFEIFTIYICEINKRNFERKNVYQSITRGQLCRSDFGTNACIFDLSFAIFALFVNFRNLTFLFRKLWTDEKQNREIDDP